MHIKYTPVPAGVSVPLEEPRDKLAVRFKFRLAVTLYSTALNSQ